MKVQALKINGYKSIDNAEISNCGNLNIFIGKNNAGKSNILSAIELVQNHLSNAVIASKWSSIRPQDEFYNRDLNRGIRIAIQFEMPISVNDDLRNVLQHSYPNMERAAQELEKSDSIVFVISGSRIRNESFLFVEQIVVGKIADSEQGIEVNGINLLTVSRTVAYELFKIQESLTLFRSDVTVLTKMPSRTREFSYLFSSNNKETLKNNTAAYVNNILNGAQVSADTRQELQTAILSADSTDDFIKSLDGIVSSLRAKIEDSLKKETSRAFTTFAGETRIQPDYVGFLMGRYGSIPLLHLRETKSPIGRDEAEALLRLKITRGGPERLKIVQNTVQSLLGVEVDAFQPEDAIGRNQGAEMDVDQFLAEANGAGVREALRLILDLELKQPSLVLVEEPEVHLHPGLEYAMYSYLSDKSASQQIFVTTHSTNFIDSVSFQNIYLVSREQGGTKVSIMDETNGALKIPASLGLKLSTVFMYDRLLFVEGPSDEAVLREFSRILNLDLARANMNFVQMGGVTNFAHYAAEGTLSLLSRRNLKIWFLTDRDERSDSEVQAMAQKLGANAHLVINDSRDLENNLLNPEAIQKFISKKLEATSGNVPTIEEVSQELTSVALSLKDDVITRRLNSKLLKPIYLQKRNQKGTLEERLKEGINELQNRLDSLDTSQAEIKKSVEEHWDKNAKDVAPGAEILDKCCQKFGVRFQKDSGDSAKLASYMSANDIPRQITELLKTVSCL